MSNSTAAHPTIWVREKKLKIRDLHLKQLHRLQCYIDLEDILFALLGYTSQGAGLFRTDATDKSVQSVMVQYYTVAKYKNNMDSEGL